MSASEMMPFSKTVGLADVMSSLPRALNNLGSFEVITVIPKYGFIDDFHFGLRELPTTINFIMNGTPYEVKVKYHENLGGLKTYLLEYIGTLTRDDIYGYDDDGYRFAFFARAIIELAKSLNFRPDVFHCHDWNVGLVPVYLKCTHLSRQMGTLHYIYANQLIIDCLNASNISENTGRQILKELLVMPDFSFS